MTTTATLDVPLDLAPRTASFEVADHQVPTSDAEAWRFAAMSAFRTFFEPIDDAGEVVAVSASPYVSMVSGGARNGWKPTDRVAAVALAGAATQVRVDIPADTTVPELIGLRLQASSSPAYQHVVVRAEARARAVVVIEPDADADLAGATEISVGDGADLMVVLLVAEGAQVRSIIHVPVSVGRDANLTLVTVVLGGGVARWQPSVRFTGPGGSATVLGAFLVQGQARLEQRVLVEHEAPHCTSRVAYKGALAGTGARSVWVGDVVVRSSAIGTDTYELNRNLLLDDGPRADSVPNLELETGDILRAGHASATGRFDEEQLFYLQARGIPESVARQLVVRGFFAEVLGSIPDASLRQRLDHELCLRLGLTDVIEEEGDHS